MFKTVSRLFFHRHSEIPVAVLSSTVGVKNEKAVVCSLFEQGLSEFHLRKPRWTAERVAAWIRAVPEKYRSRIVLHRFPELVAKYNLLGFHVEAGETIPENLPREKVSVRCRDFSDIEKIDACRCVLLGPVFPAEKRDLTVPVRTLEEFAAIVAYARKRGITFPILAFGGVTAENIHQCNGFGFDGAAVVGAIWESKDSPEKAFRALGKKW